MKCIQQKISSISLCISHSNIKKKSEGRWKIKNIHIRTKIRITKKKYFSSCLYAQKTQRIPPWYINWTKRTKKNLMQVLAFVFMSAYRQKRIQSCCCWLCIVIIWPMHIEGEWEREKEISFVSSASIFVLIRIYYSTPKNFQQFSFSRFFSLTPLTIVDGCRRLLKCVAQFSSFKIYRFFPSFFAPSPLAAVSN